MLDILRDPNCKRCDLLIKGLADLDDKGDEEEIVATCLPLIGGGEHGKLGGLMDGSRSLICGFSGVPAVRRFALSLIDEWDWNAPIEAISSVFGNDAGIRGKILEGISPLPFALRAQIIEHLAATPEDPLARKLLHSYDLEKSDELRTLASIGYYSAVTSSGAPTGEDVSRLTSNIQDVGVYFDERRRAAFAGLVLIERLDIMAGLTETLGGQVRPLSINAGDFRPNHPFLRLVAARWADIKTVFPSDVESRFSRSGQPGAFWRLMATVAPEFADFRRDLQQAVGEGPLWDWCMLATLTLSQPRSLRLREQCLHVLRRPGGGANAELARNAGTVFAEHFGGDAESLELLLAGGSPALGEDGRIVALCAGWPEHPVVSDLYKQMRGQAVNWEVGFELVSACVEAEKLPMWLDERVQNTPPVVMASLIPALVRRIQRDPVAQAVIGDLIQSGSSPILRGTLARMMAAAAKLSPPLRQWCEAEIRTQLKLASPELGYDLFSREVRSVIVSLLDALEVSREGLDSTRAAAPATDVGLLYHL
jgi:hypothetical protein